eukprot:TRINITY_DN109439_c0_g1_i1.p1 TRINITY_DN109439_c0_g1~~TRINITY_DN109439_c0_g1_i1.p1  ORF type:complete len:534 (+),score=153.76 TRINITY_DN109439_c0_g1_i1:134-1735(+)
MTDTPPAKSDVKSSRSMRVSIMTSAAPQSETPPPGPGATSKTGSGRKGKDSANGGAGKDGEEAAPERLSLNDPRMLAAMKVLGCTFEDVSSTVPPPSAPRGNASPRKVQLSDSMKQRRQEVWDRKRQELLSEVEETAAMLHMEDVQRILAPDPIAIAREEGRRAVDKAEQSEAKLELLRKAAKEDAQKIVDAHRKMLQRLEESAEKQRVAAERLAEQRKANKELLMEKIKSREEKEGKKDERLKASEKHRREDARALLSKIKGGFNKAQEHQSTTAQNWKNVREAREQHIEEVQERKIDACLTAQEEKVRAYQEKERTTNLRMETKRDNERNRAVQGEEKYTQKMTELNDQMEARQLKRESEYKKKSESLEQKKKEVEDKFKERSAAVHEIIEKRFEKRDQVLNAIRRERIEKNKEVREKFAQKGPTSPRNAHLSEEAQRKLEQRELMDELVSQNLARLQRVNEVNKYRSLARIQEVTSRVDGIVEQRQQYLVQQMQLQKEAMVEKARLTDAIRTIKVLPLKPEGETQAAESK